MCVSAVACVSEYVSAASVSDNPMQEDLRFKPQ